MKILKKFINIIDKINLVLGKAASWLTLVLVLVVCYDVVVRYLFKESSVALQELEWHLFAVIFLLSAGYTLLVDEHVRVDVFYSRFKVKNKALVDLIGTVVFLIPFCVLVILLSEEFVVNSFNMNETSPDAGGLPARFIIKGFIPLSFFFLLLQGISLAIKSALKLSGNYPLEDKDS